MSNELIAAPSTEVTPYRLLEMAVANGAAVETMERLMALQERWEANEARKAFVAAMVGFKSEPMTIGKNKHVSFQTSKGKTEYDHAELVDCTNVIVPNLAKHGLSHAWSVKQEGGRITVACTLTHVLGHSQSVELSASADDSGGKNAIQAVASTKTYLERYTLLAATGMATGGYDDDGQGYSAEPAEPEYDVQPWLDAIADATDMARLTQLGAELKERTGIPQGAKAEIRAAWAARSKVVAQ